MASFHNLVSALEYPSAAAAAAALILAMTA